MSEEIDLEVRQRATRELGEAERRFLVAHGWTLVDVEKDDWKSPDGYHSGLYGHDRDRQFYSQGHAVNSQKQRNSFDRDMRGLLKLKSFEVP